MVAVSLWFLMIFSDVMTTLDAGYLAAVETSAGQIPASQMRSPLLLVAQRVQVRNI